ncbi:MAG: FtsX-like permease family protein [Acholeplasmatales bacterium]|nr:FtsX-like permease family protein [Acholeplasmatales bacterium]
MFKKFLRTLGSYKAQMISMVIMCAIALGVFIGFSGEWYSIKIITNENFDSCSFPDYKIYSDQGFNASDIENVSSIDGIDDAIGHLDIITEASDYEEKNLALSVLSEYTMNTFNLIDGSDFSEDTKGVWVNDKFLDKNDLSIGDTIHMTYSGMTFEVEIVGSIKAANYYIAVDYDSGMIMPNFAKFGYTYMSQTYFMELIAQYGITEMTYTQIDVMSSMSKEELQEAVYDTLGLTLLVRSKTEDTGYNEAMGEVSEGKLTATAVSIIFLVIAILSLFTTFQRITRNERIQIGTFKALGFKSRQIAGVYTSIGLFVGAIGAIFGMFIGYGLCYFILNPSGPMGTYLDPLEWKLSFPAFVWPITILIILLLGAVSYLFIRLPLKEEASALLKRKTPKKEKPILLEKTKLFNKLSFTSRWNLRDVFRHKARSFMTLFGVFGAMVLLFFGFGMKDTLNALIDKYNTVMDYDLKVNISDTATDEQIEALMASVSGDASATLAIEIDDKDYTMSIYDSEYDHLHLLSKSSKEFSATKDGAYICYRLYQKGYRVGDTIKVSPYGSSEIYEMPVVGVYRTFISEGITITSDYADTLQNLTYKYDSVYTDYTAEEVASLAESGVVDSTQTVKSIMESLDEMMGVMNTMIVFMVIAAVIIGIVVLYTLGAMSFVERSRELATLKVVGFKNKTISKISIMQNIWMTIVGIIISIPLSYIILKVCVIAIGKEYEMTTYTGPLTYLASILITFITSMVVGLLVIRKNKSISMVEALKDQE